jgi:phosphoribosyl 1,2-cyclic phosphodiesterase
MKVHFWGARGSLPASLPASMVREKLFRALKEAAPYRFKGDDEIERFIDERLPFSIRGTYGTNTSCMEIREGKEYVICDCGSGLRDFGNYFLGLMKSGKQVGPGVFHIFLSHLHWDHLQGFPFFVPAYIPGMEVNIYGGHGELERAFYGQQEPPYFPVPLKAMSAAIRFTVLEPGKAYDIDGLTVKTMPQNHPGGSYGYSFEKDGKKVVYSTDCEHKEDADRSDYPFTEFFRNADILVFDAQYALAEAISIKENWGHSNNMVAVELAVRAGVKHLCIFHHEHTSDDAALDKVLEDTRRYLGIYDASSTMQIDLAYEGLEIEI